MRNLSTVLDNINARSDCTLPVTKVEGVARSRIRAASVAAVDIAHRAARDG